MTENPEPKFCCSLWLYYIRFPKTVVNKMKIKMTKFLNTSCRAGPPTGGGYRADVSIATQLRASRTVSQIKLRARFVLRRSVGGFGGSRRFFGPSRGNPVVLAPGIGRKIAAHTAGKAASPIRGISKGCPLGSLLHPFLERKGCARAA